MNLGNFCLWLTVVFGLGLGVGFEVLSVVSLFFLNIYSDHIFRLRIVSNMRLRIFPPIFSDAPPSTPLPVSGLGRFGLHRIMGYYFQDHQQTLNLQYPKRFQDNRNNSLRHLQSLLT